MEISSQRSAVDLAQLQSLRQPQRGGQDVGRQDETETAGPDESGVRVTISVGARAAEEVGRVAAQELEAATAPEVADPVTAAAPAVRPEAPAVSTAAQPDVANREVGTAENVAAGRPTDAPAGGQAPRDAAREPDAPSVANNQAVQLYLQNAARATGQPTVAPVRASA